MHPEPPSDLSGTATAKAKPSYVYSILKTHDQISETRLLPSEAKLNYIYTTLKKHHLPRVGPKLVVCVSTPRMYLHSGYFLVCPNWKLQNLVGVHNMQLDLSN